MHFLRNARDHMPRKADDDCMQELRWLYDRRNLTEAQKDLASWISRWQNVYPRLCDWVEENIAETLTFYCLPLGHHKHLNRSFRPSASDSRAVTGFLTLHAGAALATGGG